MLKILATVITASAVLVGALTTAENSATEPAPLNLNKAVVPAPVVPAPQDGAAYVGADACKKCHFKEHKTWKAMKHAGAWEVLKEEHRDPEFKDEQGQACISCHVTGWGAENGFVDATTSEHLLGVQCEACHGPGSRHVELGTAMLKEKRKELEPGEESFVVLKTTNCSNCHNPHVNHAEYK